MNRRGSSIALGSSSGLGFGFLALGLSLGYVWAVVTRGACTQNVQFKNLCNYEPQILLYKQRRKYVYA